MLNTAVIKLYVPGTLQHKSVFGGWLGAAHKLGEGCLQASIEQLRTTRRS
jgi:hypothetical protein